MQTIEDLCIFYTPDANVPYSNLKIVLMIFSIGCLRSDLKFNADKIELIIIISTQF